MRQLMSLQTSAGPVAITNEESFYKSVSTEQVFGESVMIAKTSLNNTIQYADPMSDCKPDSFIKEELIKLEKPINHTFENRFIRDSKLETQLILEQKIIDQIRQDFKIYVAKKTPTFFTKDLSLEKIEELAIEHLKHFGSQSLMAFPYSISKYQKFFVMTDPQAFKLFKTETYLSENPLDRTVKASILAKFHEMEPNKWVIGRYEDMTYLKEAQSYQRI